MTDNLYVVVLRVNEGDMPMHRKEEQGILNNLSVVLVKAPSPIEARDKAESMFPPDLICHCGASVIPYPLYETKNTGLRAIVDTLWEDHEIQTQLDGMVRQLVDNESSATHPPPSGLSDPDS